MMTMKRLEQYRALRREIEHDEKRIAALQNIRHTVYRYGNYIQTNRHADHVSDYIEYLDQINQYLHKNKTRCAMELLYILDFIDEIPDSQLREIFKLRFLDGYSWMTVARYIGNAGDGSTERKRVMRYLKRQEECDIA